MGIYKKSKGFFTRIKSVFVQDLVNKSTIESSNLSTSINLVVS